MAKVKKKAAPKRKAKKKQHGNSKYKKAYCKKLIDFFDIEPFEKMELPHYQADGLTLKWMDYKLIPARMPTLRKFAKEIGVHVSNVYEWVKNKKDFRDAFTCAKEIRKDFLIDLGLSGLSPPASFKFVAINVTDMRDQQETKLTGVVGTRELSAAEMAELLKERTIDCEDAIAS